MRFELFLGIPGDVTLSCRSFSLPVDVVALFCIVPMILGATIAFEKREAVSR